MASRARTVVVTGSEGHIGRALVQAFTSLGDHVIRVDVQQADSSNDGGSSVTSSSSTTFMQVDLATEKSILQLWEELDVKQPSVDVLICNAGLGGHRRPFHEQESSSYNSIMDVNVRAPFLMMQEAIKRMQPRQSGCITNIASTAGIRSLPLIAPYAASKAALISLTKSAALEYAGQGIRINALSPGALDRPNVQGFSQKELEDMPRQTPQGRSCLPEEVAGMAVFLASDAAAHMIGHNLVVDGGTTL